PCCRYHLLPTMPAKSRPHGSARCRWCVTAATTTRCRPSTVTVRCWSAVTSMREGVGNFVFVSHTKKPVRAGGRYGGEQGRRNRGWGAGPTFGGTRSADGVRNRGL